MQRGASKKNQKNPRHPTLAPGEPQSSKTGARSNRVRDAIIVTKKKIGTVNMEERCLCVIMLCFHACSLGFVIEAILVQTTDVHGTLITPESITIHAGLLALQSFLISTLLCCIRKQTIKRIKRGMWLQETLGPQTSHNTYA
jgi:hypothetical protein